LFDKWRNAQQPKIFSLGKAKIRRNPDGFQEFLTPHSGKRSAAWAF
jgi:hypothetical protein